MLGNGFLTSYGLVREHLARISNGPKSADFEQKPWPIAHGFEHGGFWQVLELSPNFTETVVQMLGNGFLISYGLVREELARISNGPESADFEQKPWAIAHGFEHGGFSQVLELTPNSRRTSPKCFETDF